MTGLLSPGDLGRINQITSLAVLCSSTLIAPVLTYVGRGFLEWLDAGLLIHRLKQFLKIVVVFAILSAVVIWLVQDQVNLVSSVSPVWLFALVAVYLVAYSIHTMAISGLNLLGRRLAFVAFGNLAAWAGLGLALFMLRRYGRPEAWLLGTYLGFVVSSVSFALLMRHLADSAPSAAASAGRGIPFDFWTLFMFGWPQAVVFVLWWIQSQSYRFILDRVADLASVGLFFAIYTTCSSPMQAFESLFNEFYGPTFYRAIKEQGREGLARAWNAYASAYVPAVILFGAFLAGSGMFLVKLLLGERFQAAAPIIIWPAMTETIRAINSSLFTMGIAKVDMRINLPPIVIGAVTAPTLIYLLAPLNALTGTGIALFGAGLAVLLIMIPMSYRVLPVAWPVRRIGVAVALGLPLIVGGNLASSWLPEVTLGTAIVAVSIAGIIMVSIQYLVARKWLRETYAMVR